MTNRIKRIILASVAPTAILVLTVLATSLYYRGTSSGDESLAFIVVLFTCVLSSAVLLGRNSFDRFWKVHLFSCAAAALPTTLMIVCTAIFQGTHGYFWYAVTILTFLILVVTLVSLPATYLVYAYLRELNADA